MPHYRQRTGAQGVTMGGPGRGPLARPVRPRPCPPSDQLAHPAAGARGRSLLRLDSPRGPTRRCWTEGLRSHRPGSGQPWAGGGRHFSALPSLNALPCRPPRRDLCTLRAQLSVRGQGWPRTASRASAPTWWSRRASRRGTDRDGALRLLIACPSTMAAPPTSVANKEDVFLVRKLHTAFECSPRREINFILYQRTWGLCPQNSRFHHPHPTQ
jgi:hypothetical protein